MDFVIHFTIHQFPCSIRHCHWYVNRCVGYWLMADLPTCGRVIITYRIFLNFRYKTKCLNLMPKFVSEYTHTHYHLLSDIFTCLLPHLLTHLLTHSLTQDSITTLEICAPWMNQYYATFCYYHAYRCPSSLCWQTDNKITTFALPAPNFQIHSVPWIKW